MKVFISSYCLSPALKPFLIPSGMLWNSSRHSASLTNSSHTSALSLVLNEGSSGGGGGIGGDRWTVAGPVIFSSAQRAPVFERMAVVDFFLAVVCSIELDAVLVPICIFPLSVFLMEVFSV